MRRLLKLFFVMIVITVISGSTAFTWGFFGHQKINELAVFTLPPEMIGFYKKNIGYIRETAVNPDKRRYAVPDEAARHYIDLDHYGDSALYKMPRTWNKAVALYTEDTLKAYGIVPWHIQRVYLQLKDAFMLGDPDRILKISAELGHYVADAHVPLHSTENYNGQLTGQEGIHGFWESRLPELFSGDYDFFVGKARYIENPQIAAWDAVHSAHVALDSVLRMEKGLSARFGERKYAFESNGKQTLKVYSSEYAKAYHEQLSGMVERQMRRSIRIVGGLWYSAWIDAGQPDLRQFIKHKPTETELAGRQRELELWKQGNFQPRPHED